MENKIYCSVGHQIGAVTLTGLQVKHLKRIITVEPDAAASVKISIVCDKCGDVTNILWQNGEFQNLK